MNGALLDEIGRRGAHSMVDQQICVAHRIGQSRVVTVLLVLAMNANHQNFVWWAAQTIAAELGISRAEVREAIEVLVECKVLTPAGKRSRCNQYCFDVESWQTLPNRPGRYGGAVDRRRGVAGEVAGEMAGKVAGYPATKGSEVKKPPLPPRGVSAVPARPRSGREGGKQRAAVDLAALMSRHGFAHNAYRRLERLIDESRIRGVTAAELLALAYELGPDPWDGALRIADACRNEWPPGARDYYRLIRHRLGLGVATRASA